MGPDKQQTDGAAFGNQVDDLFAVEPEKPTDDGEERETDEDAEKEDGEAT